MRCKAIPTTATLAMLLLLVVPGALAESIAVKKDVPDPQGPGDDIVWDIAERGCFDPTNKAYQIRDNRVTVDLRGKDGVCPTGLGHLASGRENVNEILFIFESAAPGPYWVHIEWNPGGSGSEQMEIVANGLHVGNSMLLDGAEKPYLRSPESFKVNLRKGRNDLVLRHLSGDGLRFGSIVLSRSEKFPLALNPKLKYPSLGPYETAIGEAGTMLDSTHVRLFAPKRKAKEAAIIFKFLVKAYDELYRLVGTHTEYKIVVYHFPDDSREAWGGTSNCTIWYGYKNLNLTADREWTAHRVPHVSGYIEEMAHNFVSATGAQFGWEMIGWSIGIKASQKVAGNPIFAKHLKRTRAVQRRTVQQYVRGGYVLPSSVPANKCDRIHAWILWRCEKKYGRNFWTDFFAEIRKVRADLAAARSLRDTDSVRNQRYQITIQCFGRLEKLNFKKKLKDLHISLTTDVKSLHPTDPGWDRTLTAAVEK